MTVRSRIGMPASNEGLQHPLMPYDVIGFVEDFSRISLASDLIASGGWTSTHVGNAGDMNVLHLLGIGGGIKLFEDGVTAADNDGVNCTKDGGMFEADDDTDIFFEIKMRIDGTHAAINWLVGLCKPGAVTMLGANGGLQDVRNAVFVCSLDGCAQIDANSTRLAGVTDTRDTAVGILVDDTWMVFKIHISGRDKIEFFLNGNLVSSSILNDTIPDGTLTPVFACKTSATNDAPEFEVKYVSCWQTTK